MSLYRLTCLNTWSLVVALFEGVPEALGGEALLEEVCHWGRGVFEDLYFIFL